MHTVRIGRLAGIILFTFCCAAAAQTQEAIVITNAPIFLYPDNTRTPLRVAAINTKLRIVEDESNGWVRVEFQDPQLGPRVGYIEARFIRIVRPELQPMDLSVKDQPREVAPTRQGPVPTESTGDGFHRGWIDVNLGFAIAREPDYSWEYEFELFAEPASGRADYHLPSGASFDFGGGVMFNRHLGVGVSFAGTAHQDKAGLFIRIPHPILPNVYATDTSTTREKLERVESSAAIQLVVAHAVSPQITVRGFGGPAYFRIRQDVVSNVRWDQTFLLLSPVNDVEITEYDSEEIDFGDTGAWGFQIGGDVSWFFNRVAGLGAFARFSRGTVEVTDPLSDDTRDVRTGGFQTGGGLRLRF